MLHSADGYAPVGSWVIPYLKHNFTAAYLILFSHDFKAGGHYKLWLIKEFDGGEPDDSGSPPKKENNR